MKGPNIYIPEEDTTKGNETSDQDGWKGRPRDAFRLLQHQTHDGKLSSIEMKGRVQKKIDFQLHRSSRVLGGFTGWDSYP